MSKYAPLWDWIRESGEDSLMLSFWEIEKAVLENGVGMFAICTESKNEFEAAEIVSTMMVTGIM